VKQRAQLVSFRQIGVYPTGHQIRDVGLADMCPCLNSFSGNYQLRYVVARDGSADQNFIEQVSGTPPVSGSPAVCCESALNDLGKVPYRALLGHGLKTRPVQAYFDSDRSVCA
jgi:hypothetical protein